MTQATETCQGYLLLEDGSYYRCRQLRRLKHEVHFQGASTWTDDDPRAGYRSASGISFEEETEEHLRLRQERDRLYEEQDEARHALAMAFNADPDESYEVLLMIARELVSLAGKTERLIKVLDIMLPVFRAARAFVHGDESAEAIERAVTEYEARKRDLK